MKRILFAALLAAGALPLFAQSADTSQFGLIIGGSRMFVEGAPREEGVEFSDATFSFANNSFDLFWATQLEPDTWLRLRAGRIEGPVPVAYTVAGSDTVFRRDANGEVQHLGVDVQYNFDEPYGSTGIFAGVGLYRVSAPDADTSSSYGFNVGVNADFPITRRYGFVLETAYHWSRTDFQPRFLY
ncbi:MAG: hypothetical protein M3Q69_12850, partial [Acidobacteriota bacterium]|nr:hypothetical protein [Acidobacteriota bacterium]